MLARSPVQRERAQQLRDAQRRLRWEAAGKLKGKYPQVQLIQLQERYVDNSLHDIADKGDLWHIVPAEASPYTTAVFEMKCPRHECVEGRFDLTSLTERMVQTQATHASGRQVCPGWHDEARYGQRRCRTQLAYDIRIAYRAG